MSASWMPTANRSLKTALPCRPTGNIRLTPDGEVVLPIRRDGRAELENARGIVALLQAVLSKNTEKIQRALGDMGFLNRHASPEVLEQIIGVLHERLQSYFHVETLNLQELQVDPQILFDTLTELRRMNVGVFEVGDFFHIPKEWILLERTLLLLTGLCTELDPTIQPMELLKPYLEKMLARDQDDWTQFALETAQEVGLQADPARRPEEVHSSGQPGKAGGSNPCSRSRR